MLWIKMHFHKRTKDPKNSRLQQDKSITASNGYGWKRVVLSCRKTPGKRQVAGVIFRGSGKLSLRAQLSVKQQSCEGNWHRRMFVRHQKMVLQIRDKFLTCHAFRGTLASKSLGKGKILVGWGGGVGREGIMGCAALRASGKKKNGEWSIYISRPKNNRNVSD